MKSSSFKVFLSLIALLVSLSSCNFYRKEVPTGSPYQVNNVYANPAYDHSHVRKTLLLPLDNPNQNKGVNTYARELISATLKNFGKFNYFHLQYDQQSSAMQNHGLDIQKGEFHRMKLGELGREYGAQGVLKVSVSEFRPFFPMYIKVKSSLVDTQTGELVWVFDHVFDTSDANVVNGMRLWWNTQKAGGDRFSKFDSAFTRPSAFLDFVFYSMAKSYGDVRKHNYKVIKKERLAREKELKKLKKLEYQADKKPFWSRPKI